MSTKRILKNRNRTRSNGVMPASFDEEARTIDLCYSAGSRVDLYDYYEDLVVSDDAIDTSRMDAGVVNLIIEHDQVSKTVGRVIDHWIEDGKAMARVKLSASQDPEVAGVVDDLINGVRRGISVGYDIFEIETVEEGGNTVCTVKSWMPTELSVVNVPADALASVRSKKSRPQQRKGKAMAGKRAAAGVSARKKRTRATEEEEAVDVVDATATEVSETVDELEELEGALDEVADGEDAEMAHEDLVAAVESLTETVATLTEASEATEEVVAEGEEEEEATGERSRKAERSRITQILAMATRHKMPAKFATRHINSGTSLDEVRMQILEARAERSPGPINGTRASILRDEADTVRKHATRRILDKIKSADSGAEAGLFRRARMVDIAKASLKGTRGLSNMADREIIAHAVRAAAHPGMHSSADFSFTTAIGDALRMSIKEYRKNKVKTWEPLTSRITVPDFRDVYTLSAGSGMNLRPIPEGGEVEFTTMQTEMGKMSIGEYAIGFALTFQTLVNDQMGVIQRHVKDTGSMEYRFEKRLFWDALLGNPVLEDGQPAFDASFGNVMTAPLSVASYAEAVHRLSIQTDLDDEEMELEPFALIVNSADYAVAKSIFAPIQATKVEDYNVFAGVEPLIVVSNKMPVGSWMLASSPDEADSVATAYLEGYEGVELQEIVNPLVNGISFIARAYGGAKLTGRRGYVMSTGTGA
ncbi:Caudovirus prohead protease [Paracoccus haematequi]|uniref:Caudovirus prohead protease n=1 Tax=Paracoccus haematequi TaxID=2491866 RepID=A0A3S4GSR1_9RHOB|nr:hypothetical protein [Paracoccus haematequi]VDS10049.1 Caudovirus prohead protease [Paracoccus haematequi]